MYCRNCGNEIDDKAVVCPHCGVATTPSDVIDSGGFGWGILGCCIPIAGLILFLVWKDSRPKTAKAAGIGALISAGLLVVMYIIIFLIGVSSATAY